MTALSDLLVAAKGDRSVDDLIAAAEKRGATLEPTFRATAYKALRGEHAKSPRESTLRQLCQVFGLDVRRVREAVQKPPGELGAWTPTPEANQLSREQRRALDLLIKAIVKGAGGIPTEVPERDSGGTRHLQAVAEHDPKDPGEEAEETERST